MAIKGILFDKDGTLVDFFATWIPAYRVVVGLVTEMTGDPALGDRLLRSGGFDPDSGALDPRSLLASGTTAEICDLWASEAGLGNAAAVSRRLHEAMDEYASLYPVPVGDGLADLFGRLADRGYALGLATMDSEAVARATVNALALSEHLSFVSGYDSGHGTKPGPGMVFAFCEVAGLTPSQVLVVGDTDRDMDMARAAGAAMAIGVLTGATPHHTLKHLADQVIESVLTIEAVLP